MEEGYLSVPLRSDELYLAAAWGWPGPTALGQRHRVQ